LYCGLKSPSPLQMTAICAHTATASFSHDSHFAEANRLYNQAIELRR
jgi:hypothetical protein